MKSGEPNHSWFEPNLSSTTKLVKTLGRKKSFNSYQLIPVPDPDPDQITDTYFLLLKILLCARRRTIW